ncbi:peptidylprolyl isomerase [Tenacibaculum aquimarinum]|uniref:peptidylprolyl isomerase n=1 Tax=Tenacibaculum aquimarinum TaxID=2910675 RepID=UPI001F0B6321|nr:peptidylprolyl isomerase [Tenacibaculum aquimarinum]MCH3882618.1 peptidylprolyl isomerase [Tenacibaculum aquimarinum]
MMQFKTKTLKNIKLLTLLFFFGIIAVNAQKVKIDGVAVVVGKNIVLDSDIDKFKEEVKVRSEGKIEISDCEMLEELMQQKLLAHHAVIDSVVVTKSQIDDRVNRSIGYFTQEYGSEEKMIKAYGFNSLTDMKEELGRVQKENLLINGEQEKLTESVDITPEEVRVYYNGLKEKNELPEFPAEIELAQLVLRAEPTKEETERVIAKLNQIKNQVEKDGASFRLKAIINSTDPSVAKNGGNLGVITKETQFIKEFKEVAFSLDEGQISEPFKSIFGYHIILLHKIKGQGREVSHILMQPEISDDKLSETKAEVEKLRKEILENKITFEEAVKKYSEDDETKNNGGILMNPYSGETTWELTRMDPELYGRVNDLKKGEITEPFYDETRGGEKMYKVILMRNRTDTHTAELVNDYVKVQQLALAKKKEETIAKWSKEKISDTYIKLNSDFKKCTFKKDWKKENK